MFIQEKINLSLEMEEIVNFNVVESCVIYYPDNSNQKAIYHVKLVENDDKSIRLSVVLIDAINMILDFDMEAKVFDELEEFYYNHEHLFKDREVFPLYRICKNCGSLFLIKNSNREFCYKGKGNNKCKVAWHRKNT